MEGTLPRKDLRSKKFAERVPEDVCRHCRGSGWKILDNCVERCRCWLRQQEKNVIGKLPAGLQPMTLENFDFSRVKKREVFSYMTAHPNAGYVLVGPYGVGKTHLLTALFMKTSLTKARTIFCSSRQLTKWFHEEARGISTRVMTYAKERKPFHLFWDDIDKVMETDFRHEMMFDLLDTMLVNMHRITVTANQDMANLDKTGVIGPDLIRRIDEMTAYQVELQPR